MDLDPTAYKILAIRWYASKIETLALEASMTMSQDKPAGYNFDRVRDVLRHAVAALVNLKVSSALIQCDPPLVPCEGFCVDDCPKPAPASGGPAQARRS